MYRPQASESASAVLGAVRCCRPGRGWSWRASILQQQEVDAVEPGHVPIERDKTPVTGPREGGQIGVGALEADDEERELAFELAYLATLTIQQRFDLMFRRSLETAELLERHGHREPVAIAKRA